MRATDSPEAHLDRKLAEYPELFEPSRLLREDEGEVFPQETFDLLNAAGMHRFYVPREWGGSWERTEDLIRVLRVISARDLTLAIGHAKTFLGAAPVWVAGSTEQRQRMASLVLEGLPISLGLTEKGHGSDLSASGVRAVRRAGGFLISGEKWLVNNATRGAGFSLLTRTSDKVGAGGTSFFLVEKAKLPPASFRHTPKIPTLGIRGADISGIEFRRAPVSEGDCIGGVGSGLDVALRTLQVTRVLCSGLSLGGGEHALRLSASFAVQRHLYGTTVGALPSVRAKLGAAFADLLLCECVALVAARSIHEFPAQMSVQSAATKYFVPVVADELIESCAVVLGARNYIRGSYASGMFQKVRRDHHLVGLFDGSTMVNLAALSVQLQRLAEHARLDSSPLRDCTGDTRTAAFSPQRFQLISASGNAIVEAISEFDSEGLNPSTVAQVARLKDEVSRLYSDIDKLWANEGAPHQSPAGFELARRYAAIHAAGCCLSFWRTEREQLAEQFRDELWLELCVQRALVRVRPELDARSAERPALLAPILFSKLERGEELSLYHREDARGPLRHT